MVVFAEKQLSREKVYSGKIIDVYRDEVSLPDGRKSVREVCEHPGAVAVLAAERGDLLFVRQYRYAVSAELIEVPAGKLEPGENPEEAARRELREETGFQCAELLHMGSICPSPGILSEVIHLYFARGLTFIGEQPDEDEFLSTVRIPRETFWEMMLHGEIVDAKTVCAVNIARARGLL